MGSYLPKLSKIYPKTIMFSFCIPGSFTIESKSSHRALETSYKTSHMWRGSKEQFELHLNETAQFGSKQLLIIQGMELQISLQLHVLPHTPRKFRSCSTAFCWREKWFYLYWLIKTCSDNGISSICKFENTVNPQSFPAPSLLNLRQIWSRFKSHGKRFAINPSAAREH